MMYLVKVKKTSQLGKVPLPQSPHTWEASGGRSSCPSSLLNLPALSSHVPTGRERWLHSPCLPHFPQLPPQACPHALHWNHPRSCSPEAFIESLTFHSGISGQLQPPSAKCSNTGPRPRNSRVLGQLYAQGHKHSDFPEPKSPRFIYTKAQRPMTYLLHGHQLPCVNTDAGVYFSILSFSCQQHKQATLPVTTDSSQRSLQ